MSLLTGGGMNDLSFARMQMAVALGFHIVFACVGMVMPFLMIVAHGLWLKKREAVFRDLTLAWSRGVAVLFAVGAVSGTVLSFELGLLWPTFMEHAGPIFGMPFSLEGTAFFLEAIAIGLYLYGWNRMRAGIHWASGLVVGISGLASGIFVVAANAWMNSPTGFDWINGRAINIDPIKAFFNDAWFSQALHMSLAAFVAVGFLVAGIHAVLLLKNPSSLFHKKALILALGFGAVASLLQPISGDISARDIARRQPLKLASAEALFETKSKAPLLIGGIPDMEQKTVNYAVKVPGALSFLAFHDIQAKVTGLDAYPKELWPSVPVVHFAFQVMVGLGLFLAGVGLFSIFLFLFERQYIFHKRFLRLLALSAPLGLIAVEAGWTVTEVGRQPWIIYGIMKTQDSLTPMPGLVYTFVAITAIYLSLSALVVWLMIRQFKFPIAVLGVDHMKEGH